MKIDFHIHTVATFSDAPFEFSLEMLERYVSVAELDAIAITNHDKFDGSQFRMINESLSIVVFPGIEINLERGHLLLISDGRDLENFQNKADQVSSKITATDHFISVEELIAIFGDLSNYLLIPHYDKNPSISQDTLNRLGDNNIFSGEVSSAKKFIYAVKDETKLTPVLFSDVRIRDDLSKLPTRQTYIDCGDLTLNAIKRCLQDKGKVALSALDGNRLYQILEDGQQLSTGLNILLGARSSGKTYTLENIASTHLNIKYIKQFQLVQQDEDSYKREFDSEIKTKRSQFAEEYLRGFKRVLDDVMNVDLHDNNSEVGEYIATLLKSAEEADRRDAYAKMKLFNETVFRKADDNALKKLFGSVRNIIENIVYKETIEKHINLDTMRNLACDLLQQLWKLTLDNNKKTIVNGIVKDVKESLKMRTASVQLEDVDLYRVAMDEKRVARFTEIVAFIKTDQIIAKEGIQAFTVVARQQAFVGAQDIRNTSPVKLSFSPAFSKYDYPYEYLQILLALDGLPETDIYKLFTNIKYQIINREGNPVSGGERSEFRLLQEIKDAQKYDMLLIDEPESSFDNVFLNSDVNKIIKEISESMPVVVVTHNSTIGASIGANYVLYASKEIENGEAVFRLYGGYPTDINLKSVDGSSMRNHTIMMNSLEAGEDSYEARRKVYEAIKN